jgi:hypothetical protein
MTARHARVRFPVILSAWAVISPWLALPLLLFAVRDGAYVPVYNDEVSWFHQVKTLVDAGWPDGYYGYNGTHSDLGIGPWGIGPLLPYAAFGAVFGWSPWSLVVANLVFLGLGQLFVVLVARPVGPARARLAVSFGLIQVFVLGTGWGMTERMRVALAMVSVGVLLWSLRADQPPRLHRGLALAVAMLMCVAYLPLVVFVPIVAWGVFRGWRRAGRLAMAGASALSALLVGLIAISSAAPYPGSRSSALRDAFESGSVGQYVVDTALLTAEAMLPWNYTLGRRAQSWYLVALGLLLIGLAAVVIWRRARGTRWQVVSLFIGGTTLLGVLVGYTMSPWNVGRAVLPAVAAIGVLLAIAARRSWLAFAVPVVIAAVPVASWNVSFMPKAYGMVRSHEGTRSDLADVERLISHTPGVTGWENTVAVYGPLKWEATAVPGGMGLHLETRPDPRPDTIPARYAMVRGDEIFQRRLSGLLERAGYVSLGSAGSYTVWRQGASPEGSPGLQVGDWR